MAKTVVEILEQCEWDRPNRLAIGRDIKLRPDAAALVIRNALQRLGASSLADDVTRTRVAELIVEEARSPFHPYHEIWEIPDSELAYLKRVEFVKWTISNLVVKHTLPDGETVKLRVFETETIGTPDNGVRWVVRETFSDLATADDVLAVNGLRMRQVLSNLGRAEDLLRYAAHELSQGQTRNEQIRDVVSELGTLAQHVRRLQIQLEEALADEPQPGP
jgi:hypothetical protein